MHPLPEVPLFITDREGSVHPDSKREWVEVAGGKMRPGEVTGG